MIEESIKITLDNSSTQYQDIMETTERYKLRLNSIVVGIYEVSHFETRGNAKKVETTFILTRVERADKAIIDK